MIANKCSVGAQTKRDTNEAKSVAQTEIWRHMDLPTFFKGPVERIGECVNDNIVGLTYSRTGRVSHLEYMVVNVNS